MSENYFLIETKSRYFNLDGRLKPSWSYSEQWTDKKEKATRFESWNRAYTYAQALDECVEIKEYFANGEPAKKEVKPVAPPDPLDTLRRVWQPHTQSNVDRMSEDDIAKEISAALADGAKRDNEVAQAEPAAECVLASRAALEWMAHHYPDNCEKAGLHALYTRHAAEQSLDDRMRAAGMISVAELLAGVPMDNFFAHAGVNDLGTFEKWLEMRREEYIRMQAKLELDSLQKDELYDWVVSHNAVYHEVLVNFRAAKLNLQAEPAAAYMQVLTLPDGHKVKVFSDHPSNIFGVPGKDYDPKGIVTIKPVWLCEQPAQEISDLHDLLIEHIDAWDNDDKSFDELDWVSRVTQLIPESAFSNYRIKHVDDKPPQEKPKNELTSHLDVIMERAKTWPAFMQASINPIVGDPATSVTVNTMTGEVSVDKNGKNPEESKTDRHTEGRMKLGAHKNGHLCMCPRAAHDQPCVAAFNGDSWAFIADEEVVRANARRVLAAWNACAGFSIHALEVAAMDSRLTACWDACRGVSTEELRHRGMPPSSTPPSRWSANGEPDPHDDYYNCERAKLELGEMTDDELANAIFLVSIPGNIRLQTAVKERLRWLSRQLQAKQAQQPETKDAPQ